MLASTSNDVRVSENISALKTISRYLLEKQKNLDKALVRFKETNGREAGDLIMASDRSFIALLCDNLATLATVWAEVRRDFFDFFARSEQE